MRKKLYFEPPKPTKLHEYIIIEYGKIRNVHFLQMREDLPPGMEDAIKKQKLNIKIPVHDQYTILKDFHLPPKFLKVDPYIKKQKKAEYTHELILPSWEEVNKYFGNLNQKTIYPPSEYMLKTLVRHRKVFVKLSLLENLKINYYSGSWSSLNTDQKIKIMGIIIGSTISITLAIIGWLVFGG